MGERRTEESQGQATVFISSTGYNVHGAMEPEQKEELAGEHGLRSVKQQGTMG